MKLTGLGLLQGTSCTYQPYLVFDMQLLIKTGMFSDKLIHLLFVEGMKAKKNDDLKLFS